MSTILLLSLLAALFFVALILVALQRDYWRDRALYAEALEVARNEANMRIRNVYCYGTSHPELYEQKQPHKPTETEK